MITTNNTNITVESNIQGNKIAMSIDDAATAHIMSVLTDLYSDPELAIIREYSTNALDAHIEARNPAPIEVTTPTDLSPFLRIRDYGVGLDADDIANIYSRYGASTKRETNEQVGMLGLGCKSALTYTSQFTLVGIKNGVKTVVAISRDGDGAGSMTVVEHTATTEPNGVEVVIPAKTYNEIEDKARDFFRFWQPGTVLVNGEAPAPLDGLRVTDEIVVIEREGWGNRDYIVMGNVPYPANFDHGSGKVSVVAYVGIGEVAFTPSRESLYSCPQTDATIETVKQAYADNIDAAIERAVSGAQTFADAFRVAARWRSLLNRKVDVTYNGRVVPLSIDAPAGYTFTVANVETARGKASSSVHHSISPSILINGLFVYGYNAKFTAVHKQKLAKYCETHNLSVKHFVLTDAKPDATWIDDSMLVPYETIRAIKLDRAARVSTKNIQGSYEGYINGAHRYEIDAAEITGRVAFYNTTTHDKDEVRNIVALLDKCGWQGTVVLCPQNRINKFCRDFPHAKPAHDFVKAYYQSMVAAVTTQDWQTASVDRSVVRDIRNLDLSKVDDPAFTEYVALADRETSDAYKRLIEIFGTRRWTLVDNHETVEDPFDNYPLLGRISYYDKADIEHAYIYINAAYAKRLADEAQTDEGDEA